MGKIKKALRNTVIGLGIIGSVYAQNQKIDNNVASTKKDLVENVKENKNIITTDKETETIISYLCNFGDEEMKALWLKHGYSIDSLELNSLRAEKDTLLYETIKELNQKYGNPKITIQSQKIFNRGYGGSFSVNRNLIDIDPYFIDAKKYMIEVWLAELSHAKQFQKGHMTLKTLQDELTLITKGFNYHKLYDIKGTIEYEAHKIIEPELIHEFIKTYVSKIDTNDSKQVAKAENMLDLYAYTREQADTVEKNMQFIVNKAKQEKLAREKDIQDLQELQKKIDEYLEQSRKLLEETKQQAEKNKKMSEELEKELGKTP